MDIDSPSRHETIDSLKESPTFTATLRSNTLGLGLSNKINRPLIHKTGMKFNTNSISNSDLSFSSFNKENINHNASNNITSNNVVSNLNSNSSLYKSFTFNGNQTLSRKASFKKQMKKKSSNLFRTCQSNHTHGHNRSHSHSQNYNHNHNLGHHRSNSHGLSHSHRHTKSNSSNTPNTLFTNLSAKPSIDSIFNFTHDNSSTTTLNTNTSNNQSHFKTLFSQANTNFIISPESHVTNVSNFSTPNYSETDSYYSSDENISDSERHLGNESFDNGNDNDDSDNSNFDLGSPLQKKQSNKNMLMNNINQIKLHRHQSLMQFGNSSNSASIYRHPNLKFETDQLASNINGLTVNSDDDESVYGNSLLHDASFNFSSNEHGKVPRISVGEFKKIFKEYRNKSGSPNGKFCKHFDELMIVDCRFSFEFKGGHIDGAINISSFTELEAFFFNDSVLQKNPVEFNNDKRRLLVFHCEFSSHRGPMKADQLRYFDRSICGDFYPNLYYPDVVVLEGGYKDYYDSEKTLHKSLSYIEMEDPLFKAEKERNLTLLRRESSLSRKSSRNSSSVSLSRKTSHSSIKSINSSSILDFSSVNKVDFNQRSKPRPGKRFLPNINSNSNSNINNNNNDQSNENLTLYKLELDYQSDGISSSSTPNAKTNNDDGLFGGFGNRKIDLDRLVDGDDIDTDYTPFEHTNDTVPDAVHLEEHCNNIKNTIKSSRLPYANQNEGFKVPLPRTRYRGKSGSHFRSNTVSSFTYSIPPGFNSAPLLSTPEKFEAKFGNIFYQHNDSSVYSVQEADEGNAQSDHEYKSIYSSKVNKPHLDTPIREGRK